MNLEKAILDTLGIGTFHPEYMQTVEDETPEGSQFYNFGEALGYHGMDLELRPQDDLARVHLYAYTKDDDLMAVSQDIWAMHDRQTDIFLGVYKARPEDKALPEGIAKTELLHEDQAVDQKRYEMTIPIKTQEQLCTLIGIMYHSLSGYNVEG